MAFEGKSRRISERKKLVLPVRVKCRENADFEWTEVTRLTDITPFGAGLTLKRPVTHGQLLHLTLPMPIQMRAYDYDLTQYQVWGLVCHVKAREKKSDLSVPDFHVGIAFIGKYPPAGYEKDPTTLYEPEYPKNKSFMWGLRPLLGGEVRKVRQEDRRKETRLTMPLEVVMEVFDDQGRVSAKEQTVTENVSPRGAAVYTILEVKPGEFVRLRSAQYHAVSAVVRGRRQGQDGITRLHLEFITNPWPLEGYQ